MTFIIFLAALGETINASPQPGQEGDGGMSLLGLAGAFLLVLSVGGALILLLRWDRRRHPQPTEDLKPRSKGTESNQETCVGCKATGCLEKYKTLGHTTFNHWWVCRKCGLVFNGKTLKPVPATLLLLTTWGVAIVIGLGVLFYAWLLRQ